MLSIIVLVIAFISLSIITLYSVFTALLARTYGRNRAKTTINSENKLPAELPVVTIQLPLYNELYVTERLLDSVAKMNYPKEKLEIQVLDDSTDETVEIAKEKVSQLQAQGFNITHLTRLDRKGFKAGALKEGLAVSKGEYVAIFDADFVPPQDWLLSVLPFFNTENVGLVQTKWGHLNRDESVLTQVQGLALDMHFSVEQVGRNTNNHFINFNGTAGMWLKACILDAGNWEGDTLTEDLDLSYRAQLKNWDFRYVEDIVSPAELPSTISASRSQQFRWNKGGAENFQKFFFKILKNRSISISTKLHCYVHLLNSTLFLNVLILALLSVPLILLSQTEKYQVYFTFSTIFTISTLNFIYTYWQSYKVRNGGGLKRFFKFLNLFFKFLCIAMGFSLSNSIAVILGHFRVKSSFIRTPKFNNGKHPIKQSKNKYKVREIKPILFLELLLTCYFAFGMYLTFTNTEQGWMGGLFLFCLMLFLGFGYVVVTSIREVFDQ